MPKNKTYRCKYTTFFSEQSDKTQKTIYYRIKKMSAARIRKTGNGDKKGVLGKNLGKDAMLS